MTTGYTTPADTPLNSNLWVYMSTSNDAKINFTMKEVNMMAFDYITEARPGISDAAIFAEQVKEMHRLPIPQKECWLLNMLNVVDFGYNHVTGSVYKLAYFDFKDGSTWENGLIYD